MIVKEQDIGLGELVFWLNVVVVSGEKFDNLENFWEYLEQVNFLLFQP